MGKGRTVKQKKQAQRKAPNNPSAAVHDPRPSSELNEAEFQERQLQLEAMCGGKEGWKEFVKQYYADHPAAVVRTLREPGMMDALAACPTMPADKLAALTVLLAPPKSVSKADERFAQLMALIPPMGDSDSSDDEEARVPQPGGQQTTAERVMALCAQIQKEDEEEVEERKRMGDVLARKTM